MHLEIRHKIAQYLGFSYKKNKIKNTMIWVFILDGNSKYVAHVCNK